KGGYGTGNGAPNHVRIADLFSHRNHLVASLAELRKLLTGTRLPDRRNPTADQRVVKGMIIVEPSREIGGLAHQRRAALEIAELEHGVAEPAHDAAAERVLTLAQCTER